ncbi:MAG: hypothetical protein P1U58_09930 [Verrucomicrobiales bacterium]|nr:hypothetical protein [Verrucomicrobiales bacterium]
MSVPGRRKKARRAEKSALQILEESFHLLRTIDLRYFWLFYLGAVPFVVVLLYFAADMSRSSLAGESMLVSSLIMTALYFWLRFSQAIFCRGLWKTIQPESDLIDRPVDRFKQLAALFIVQAFQIPLLVIGLLLALPLGWIIAFLQNSTVLSLTRSSSSHSLRNMISEGWKFAHHEWAQNHAALVILAIVTFFTWVNLVATCLILATFAKSFLGVESMFTISPLAAILNTTFVLGSILLTYLVVSPILKAVYTLRCFYSQSRGSGEDILSRLAAFRVDQSSSRSAGMRRSAAGRAAVVAILIAAFPNEPARADEKSVNDSSTGILLEESISEAMAQKKYQWRLSRRLQDLPEDELEKGWLSRQLYELGVSLRALAKEFTDWLEDAFDRLERQESKQSNDSKDKSAVFDGISSALSIGLVLLVVGLGLWLGLLIYRKHRNNGHEDQHEEAPVEMVDLQREDIVASQLPENEWLRLAREQIERGDRRLAIRALFLASLAKLGDENLVNIARFKSNRDYRLELKRKARKWNDLISAFEANTKLFERAWYGWHEVSEDAVESYLKNHEVMVNLSKKAGKSRYSTATESTVV